MISKHGENLVFICGLPRSGTTLLSAIMGNHPDVSCPPEPWVLLRLAEVYGEAASGRPYDDHIAAQAVKKFMNREDFLHAARAFAHSAYNRTLDRAGGKILVDKTPRYYHILDLIEELFPAARLIWLKRNPLDVAASYKTTWNRGIPFLSGETFDATSFDFPLGLPRLKQFFDGSGAPRLEIRYEDLVNQPEAETRKLAAFCKLAYQPEMLDMNHNGKGLSWLRQSEFGDRKIHSSNKIHNKSIGAWQNQLHAGEAIQVAAIVGSCMFERMGYAETVQEHPDLFAAELGDEALLKAQHKIISKARSWSLNLSAVIYDLENRLNGNEQIFKELRQLTGESSAGRETAEARTRSLQAELEKALAKNCLLSERMHILEQEESEESSHLQELKKALAEAQHMLTTEKDSATAARHELENRLTVITAERDVRTELLHEQTACMQRAASEYENRLRLAVSEKNGLEATLITMQEQIRNLQTVTAEYVTQIRFLELNLKQADQQLDKIVKGRTYCAGKMIVKPLVSAKNATREIRSRLTSTLQIARQSQSLPAHHVRKIDIADQLQTDYGKHRSGWKYGLQCLSKLHNPHGILFDSFIERTFFWHPDGIKPHTRPWIGVIHVPPHIPDWFIAEQSNEAIFRSEAWQKSLPLCRGLFTLSEYHKSFLEKKLQLPINRLIFPTQTPNMKWSWKRFKKSREKRIIQVGWWLRKLHAIYQLPPTGYQKTVLDCGHPLLPELIERERRLLEKDGQFNEALYRTAQVIHFLPDAEYDRLLSENIVFTFLYDASANNTVTECIVRNTPILINPIEPVREYLGDDYPFYFQTLEEAAQKAMDMDLVYRTHLYLAGLPIKNKLSGEYFLDSIAHSPIYNAI